MNWRATPHQRVATSIHGKNELTEPPPLHPSPSSDGCPRHVVRPSGGYADRCASPGLSTVRGAPDRLHGHDLERAGPPQHPGWRQHPDIRCAAAHGLRDGRVGWHSKPDADLWYSRCSFYRLAAVLQPQPIPCVHVGSHRGWSPGDLAVGQKDLKPLPRLVDV